jgi:two-component system, OmpR family, alkaline phosphatase synthesis response regulator PhoP
MTKKIKVLTIDDEADFCYFVKMNLMENKLLEGLFNVIIATDCEHGIELARSEQPDIILLDLVMPDMPGEDVAAALNEHPATTDIPILYITALATDEDIGESGKKMIGNNHILPKPVRTKILVENILRILNYE